MSFLAFILPLLMVVAAVALWVWGSGRWKVRFCCGWYCLTAGLAVCWMVDHLEELPVRLLVTDEMWYHYMWTGVGLFLCGAVLVPVCVCKLAEKSDK